MASGTRTMRDLALLAALRLSLSAVAWWAGFRAVSDDDFARVVHAQEWAHTPALDPTGTSWLPVPFWLNGMVMLVLGTDLDVARGVAWALGVASTWLLYAAGRLLVGDERSALLGAAIATALPWSIRLGVATVPELPTAALTVFAVATIASRRHLLLGGLALVAATLSRYEPWPVAAAFGALCAWDLLRRQRVSAARPPVKEDTRDVAPASSPAGNDPRSPGAPPSGAEPEQQPPAPRTLVVAAMLAALGPAAWIAHNAIAHGDAFHFLARVAAYREKFGGSADLLAYPLALVREEPEIAATAMVLAILTWRARAGAGSEGAKSPEAPVPAWRTHAARSAGAPSAGPRAPARRIHAASNAGASSAESPAPAWRRTLPRTALCLGLMLATLILAAARGGAPTHHAGRAVLAIWLAAALLMAPAIRAILRARARYAFALLVAVIMPLGALVLRPWYARLDRFTPRHDEVAIGRAAATLARPHDRILVVSSDYRHFAIQAATGRPWAFAIARPNEGMAPTPTALMIARPGTASGAPIAAQPTWAAWRVNAAADEP